MARICMLVTSELDTDPRVKKEAESAAQAGYEVFVICRSFSKTSPNYQIISVGTKRPGNSSAKYWERFITNILLVWKAVRLRPAIVHANDLDTLPAGYLVALLTGAKLLYDAHEFWADAGRDVGIGKKLIPIIEKLLIRRCDAVVAASKYRAQLMSQAYDIPLPTTVMNTPLQANYPRNGERAESKEAAQKGDVQVLHLGVYRPHRGLENAILSAQYLPDTIKLTFVGYGEIEGDLHELVRQHSLESRVTFLPPVRTEDVVDTASGYDIGLVLYRSVNLNNLYAAPNKLFEYMMAGLAIAGSDLPLIREVIESEQVGVTFDSDSPQDIADKILHLASDIPQLNLMKERARSAGRKYTWQIESAKLLNLYSALLQQTQ